MLSEDVYLASDDAHFKIANETLYQATMQDSTIANELGLTSTNMASLANGQTPEGYTWHHNEELGILQLVDEKDHKNTGHTGGRELWGGGTEYR